MFSIANNFTAPPVKIASERKPEYHPRTYSQFVKGLKNKELPAVIVKPSENVAQFQEENGDYGDVRIVQTEQLWQTLMDSDAEVLVDTSGPPMSFAETGIMLIRAIAGESNVPFIQCSAANFVEMFVGVGAKRVRELFQQARENQPCIVFIDEIDAVGKKRSAGGMPSNDEREQTINQLLTEMDGFDNETGIVVIAATNRIDILDDALLRPGRFDRKIQVTLPSVQGRKKILGVHSRDKNLSEDVDLGNIAKQTTGFSGADLANLMNECAIRAVRDGEGVITNDIVENVYQRVVVGAKGDVKFSLRKKELVAYHEAGHAIMGVLVPDYDTVRKVSIIPRGAAGGITFFQPNEENADSAMYTKEYLLSQIKVALGGRAAEQIIYGKDKITTGASSDYALVYQIAREMVTTYGFGQNFFDYRSMSEEASALVDNEIDLIVGDCYDETVATLKNNMPQLERLKEKLIEEEIVDGEWVYELLGKDSSVSFD
jgi:cell division protease FtsH